MKFRQFCTKSRTCSWKKKMKNLYSYNYMSFYEVKFWLLLVAITKTQNEIK